MKKLFIVLVALVSVMLASCQKDSTSKLIFSDSAIIENVSYSTTINKLEEGYNWTVVNSTDEVTVRYTYTYDTKKYLCKDFAAITEELKKLDDTALGTLLPVFTYEFNFIDNEDNSAVITRTVKDGNVFVNFVFGEKSFSMPYTFIIGANDLLNPKQ